MHSATKELLHHRPPSLHQQSVAGRQYETITEVNNITWNTIDRLDNTKPTSLVVAVLTTDTKSILALCLSCRCGRIHLNSQTHILSVSIHMFYSKQKLCSFHFNHFVTAGVKKRPLSKLKGRMGFFSGWVVGWRALWSLKVLRCI
jgi:hypothetical protein